MINLQCFEGFSEVYISYYRMKKMSVTQITGIEIQSDSIYTSEYESIKLYQSDKIYASLAFGFINTVNETNFQINTL